MSSKESALRSRLIRLAAQKPELRNTLLPLLGKGAFAGSPTAKVAAQRTIPVKAGVVLELGQVRNQSIVWDITYAHPYPEGAEVRHGDAEVSGHLVFEVAGSLRQPLRVPFRLKIQVLEANSGHVGIFADTKSPLEDLVLRVMNDEISSFDSVLFNALGKIPHSPAYDAYIRAHK